MIEWLRLWHDMPTDPKWRAIARKSGQPLPCVIALFNLLLVNASANTAARGTLSNWNDDDAAAALDMDEEQVAAIIAAMEGKVISDGALTGWDRRQPKREDGTASERKLAWKERQQNALERIGTQKNAPDTETDTDTDTKKEDTSLRSVERASAPTPPKASPKARGSRIAPDWSPSPDDRQSARSEGMPETEIDRTAAKFRDFWTGKAGASGVKLDWPATWRNWVRSDCEKRGWVPVAQTATGPPQSNGWRPGLPTDAELRAKYARMKNPEPDDEYAPTH